MTWDVFDRWAPQSVSDGAAQLKASGLLEEPEATARVREQLAELLPAGIATPLHLLWTVRATVQDALVGHLWMRIRPSSDEVEAFVLDVDVLPELRGHGWGRATMLAAEQAARDAGASVLRLSVFGHNSAGVRLYEGLEYGVVGATMTRQLDVPSRTAPAGPVAEASVRLDPMTVEQYAGFRDRRDADHGRVRPGVRSAEGARRSAAADLDRLLPDGPATPGHRLWSSHADAGPVADVWVRLEERSGGRHASLQELRLVLGDRLIAVVSAVERSCRALGARSLTVSVPESLPACSSDAQAVLEHCGFRVAAQTMAKALT